MKKEAHEPHARQQRDYFDKKASFFLQPIPEDIQARTRRIVQSAELTATSKVLDVGTGAGVLIGHFLAEGVSQSNIVGCDLSENMLANARERYPDVHYFHGDVVDLGNPEKQAQIPAHLKRFDAVFFNACFGNVFDQVLALKTTRELLTVGGRIVLSHPLGAKFVKALHDSEPEIVPHLLPTEELLQSWGDQLDMTVAAFVSEPNYYLAILRTRDE